MKHSWARGEGWGKATAAMIGGFLVFLVLGAAVGTGLPRLGVPLNAAVALSIVLAVLAWPLAVAWAVLAQSGLHAWLRVGGLAAGLALV
ncbi:MAG: hypothetical protein AAF752_16560, partial [Bacteroidota bacterium]